MRSTPKDVDAAVDSNADLLRQFISTSNPGGRYSLQLDRALDMQ